MIAAVPAGNAAAAAGSAAAAAGNGWRRLRFLLNLAHYHRKNQLHAQEKS